MRSACLYLLPLTLFTACGEKDPGETDPQEADTGAEIDDNALATLVGDEVAAEETAWAYGFFQLELSGDTLTGTIDYAEDTDSRGEVCEGVLSVVGTAEQTAICEDEPCTWSYTFTVEDADITSGECDFQVADLALNLASPDTVGALTYWEDTWFDDELYAQYMMLGYQNDYGWAGYHILSETETVEQDVYDAGSGTVRVDLGGIGTSVSLLHDGECDDVTNASGELLTVDEPLTGSVEEGWDAIVDVWEIPLVAGQTLQVSAVPVVDGADMEVDLISPEGCLQVAGDDWVDCGESSSCGSLSYTAEEDGVWSLLVEGDWCTDDTCEYALHIAVE